MTETVRGAIYARISSDAEGFGLGVQRQTDDCRSAALKRGWKVETIYTDNDVSATRSKVRPEYQRMLADIAAGRITGVIVWDVDRLTRTPRELEDIIDLADRQGLSLASVGGEIDLSTPQGRMTARIKGTVARHETEQQSRRLRRKFQERAEAGKPHSFAAYGYRRINEFDDRGHRVNTRDELDQEQAAIVRQAARLLLAGQSLRAVTTELNTQGALSPRGKPWASATLKQIMVRDRNAGLRTHRGEIIGKGQWPPIYDEGTHDRVVALLTDPSRRTNKGTARKHLLTGLARCGLCAGPMVVNIGRVTADGRQPSAYTCQQCTRIRRKQSAVDEVVEGVMIARLTKPDALSVLAAGDPEEAERAAAEMAALGARLELAADEYAEGNLTGPQLKRITANLRPKIEGLKSVVSSHSPAPGLLDLVGDKALERWHLAPLEVKRTVIDLLATVTIMPTGSGKRFDPELIKIEWKANG
ncbi:recombinase family protein [Nakamurella antarctica]|uniref:Recombinase family protein n=1 Tax=Nakamurella antarctica TaxID=1902245 RepID=A0A3G8ZMK1_9ACTN|nr:recombinase family protein [Nakamurella antarctica]AZI58378.1 recombinase family protein [Nakamurella antarctica]